MLEESTGNFSATRNVYDWYQDCSHVIINVMIKNLKESDVKVKLIDETLDVTCNLADGSEFRLHFNLFKSIYVAESSWSVTPSKLEIKLKKTDRKRWQSLEVIPTDKGQHKRSSSAAGLGNSPVKRMTAAIGQTNNLLNTAEDDATNKAKAVKFDWYQSNDEVKINVHIAQLNPDDVQIELTEKTLDCSCTMPNGGDYRINLFLFKSIHIEQSTWQVTSSKLEITLKKQEPARWSTLELTPQLDSSNFTNSHNELNLSTTAIIICQSDDPSCSDLPIVQGIADNSGTEMKAQNSNNSLVKDKELSELDKVVAQFKEKEKKEEEKAMDAGVDDLFREIYEKGGEEVRRAMSKSFTESGGLC